MTAGDDLVADVRAALAEAGTLREVRMFGGIGFMLNGNMVAAVSRRGLLLRVGKERYAEALTQKLRTLPPKILETATYHVRDLRSFFEKNRLLYLSEGELESIRDRVRTEIGKRKNPLLVDLGDDEATDDLAKSIEA